MCVVFNDISRGVKPPICIYDTQQMVENNAWAGTVVEEGDGVGKIGAEWRRCGSVTSV